MVHVTGETERDTGAEHLWAHTITVIRNHRVCYCIESDKSITKVPIEFIYNILIDSLFLGSLISSTPMFIKDD